MNTIDVAQVYSDEGYLGKRKKNDSDYSGEGFREEYLEELLNNPNSSKTCYDFDNCYTFPPSFMSEAFQVLFKNFKSEHIFSKIKIKISSKLQRQKLLEKIHEVDKKVTEHQLFLERLQSLIGDTIDIEVL